MMAEPQTSNSEAPADVGQTRPLELPDPNIAVDSEFAKIWSTAEVIGALSTDDYRWSFTSILLALLYSEQDISQWLLSYANSANINLAEIGNRRGFDPTRLPSMREEFARGGAFLKKSPFTSSSISLFRGATALYGSSVPQFTGAMGARHLVGAFIYRLPGGHADQMQRWGIVPADWSAHFLEYLSSRVPQETFWADLHQQHFGADQAQAADAVVPFDVNRYTLSFAAQQILRRASARAAISVQPVSSRDVLLEMAEHGRVSRDPQWAGDFLLQAVEEHFPAYQAKRAEYLSASQDRPLESLAQPQASTMKPGLAWCLGRASEIALQTAGASVIAGRHLLASLIADPPPPHTLGSRRLLDQMGIDSRLFSERLYNWVRGYGDNDKSWREVLLGGHAEPLRKAEFDADNTTGPDLLQIEQDVLALATLIAARDSSPPLSIGLFGDWGSGKTFFMGQLRRTIAQLAEEANQSKKMQRDLPFYKRIVQIEFNAWHYVEGNLWASMVEHILENLCVSEKRSSTATEQLQKYWINKLGFAEKAKVDADRKAAEASEKVSNAEREVQAAASQLEIKKDELEKLSKKSAARDFKLSGALPVISQSLEPLGLKPLTDAVIDLQSSLGQAWTVLERGHAALVPLVHAKDKKNRWRSLLIILLGAPLAGALVGGLLLFLGKTGIAQIAAIATGAAGLLSGVAAWLRTQAQWVSQQTEKVREAQSLYDKELANALAGMEAEKARTEQDLASARQDYVFARQRADEARRQADVARSDLAAATTSRLLGQFIQDRAASTDYRKHLGVLAIVRQDFQELSRLIEEDNWRLSPDTSSDQRFARLQKVKNLEEEEIDLATRINRIVLYIDDLDRCPPAKVVEVLQAVHLLLAFPLFVVVVGVDARWISRSLEARYCELLHVGNPEAAVDLTQMFGVARSEDYLEKIFQIPLWLRIMDAGAARRMVQGLLRPTGAALQATPGQHKNNKEATDLNAPVPLPQGGASPPHQSSDNGGQSALPSDAADKSQAVAFAGTLPPAPTGLHDIKPAVPNLESLRVSDPELAAIDDLAPLLGRSPRALKRFVNLYRLIKARLTPAEHNAFVRRNEDSMADYEAVLILLAVDTGLPRVSRLVFAELTSVLCEPEASGLNLSQFIERLRGQQPGETSEWNTLINWMSLRAGNERFNHGGVLRMAGWVEQVSRYSFQAVHIESRMNPMILHPLGNSGQ